MYKIKEYPEDFIVKEITNLSFRDSGKYLVCVLKKKNYTTMRAVEQIAKVFDKKIKDIGFSGIKDKNAVTEQYISIKNVMKEDIEKVKLKDIELRFVGYLDKPISLGDLSGNEFIITVRDFKGNVDLEGKTIMPNFFGEQRFSRNNVKIGKSLLRSDFKEALKLILETNSDYKEKIQEFIKDKPNDFIGALKLIPKKLLKLYAHAYQSYLWNKTLKEYTKDNKKIKNNCTQFLKHSLRFLEFKSFSNTKKFQRNFLYPRNAKHFYDFINNKKNIKIPLIGFGTEVEDKKINKIITKIMEKENLTFRSFINRSISDISLEGNSRDAFIEIKDLKILEKGNDFVKISFKLPKGSYATVAVEFLLN